jgi:hypothetical protein
MQNSVNSWYIFSNDDPCRNSHVWLWSSGDTQLNCPIGLPCLCRKECYQPPEQKLFGVAIEEVLEEELDNG